MCMIESVTIILLAEEGNLESNEEEVDPIICAVDLLDGIVEGIGESFAALVGSSQRYGKAQFASIVVSLCSHEIAGVRMSVLALLGDLARKAPDLIEPVLPQLLEQVIAGMDPIQPSVATNAVWALGEICLRAQGNDAPIKPYAPYMLQNLISLLMGNGGLGGGGRGTDIPGLSENAAACVGRLTMVNAQFVAPDLSRFMLGWCDGMAKITDPNERRDAFQGFIQAVYANPEAIKEAAANVADSVASIIFAIVTWHMPTDLPDQSTVLLSGDYNFRPFPQQEAELGAALFKLLHDMKSSIGHETWLSVQKNLPVNVRRLLREAYKL
jgi:hypothetical protein